MQWVDQLNWWVVDLSKLILADEIASRQTSSPCLALTKFFTDKMYPIYSVNFRLYKSWQLLTHRTHTKSQLNLAPVRISWCELFLLGLNHIISCQATDLWSGKVTEFGMFSCLFVLWITQLNWYNGSKICYSFVKYCKSTRFSQVLFQARFDFSKGLI